MKYLLVVLFLLFIVGIGFMLITTKESDFASLKAKADAELSAQLANQSNLSVYWKDIKSCNAWDVGCIDPGKETFNLGKILNKMFGL